MYPAQCNVVIKGSEHYLGITYESNGKSYAVVERIGDPNRKTETGEGRGYQKAIYDGIDKLEASL